LTASWGENWHSNHDTYWQQQDIAFGGTPATGTSKDAANRSVDAIFGSNFADGKGNVTGFFSYFHTDRSRVLTATGAAARRVRCSMPTAT